MLFLKVFKSRFLLATIRKFSNYHSPLFPLLKNIELFPERTAVVDEVGKSDYKHILSHSYKLALNMRRMVPELATRKRMTVPFLCTSDASYVCTLLACWINGNIAVPLCKEHPSSLLEYFLKDSCSSMVVCSSSFKDKVKPLTTALKVPLFLAEHPLSASGDSATDSTSENSGLFPNKDDDGAIIIYTSGTTGPPKGVLLTHSNLHAQVCTLVEAWGWTLNDAMLHVLPLHHVHGLVNCLLCPLAVGATVVMLPKFDALEVWDYFVQSDESKTKINLFSAVPTCFAKMVQKYDEAFQKSDFGPEKIKEKCTDNIRLMTCGSSALPDSVFHAWEQLTGHVLLERYGMSEIGMALSNPLHGTRLPGSVGVPLPAVKTRIVRQGSSEDDESYVVLVEGGNGETKVLEGSEGEPGELHVKGPSIFKEYWNKPDATKKAFTKDGWFKTGDIAVFENGVYRIFGRASADIVKTGGFKVSTLDVERHLLECSGVDDCAVFGLPDDTWGEILTAMVAAENDKELNVADLKDFCKTRLPSYSVPKLFKFVDHVPRNVMGKVNKKDLRDSFRKEMEAKRLAEQIVNRQ